jgi:hypothetical protein
MRIGRTIAVAVVGFLFMLFVAADLVLFGVVPLNSVVVTILPLLGVVFGFVVGIVAGDRGTAPDDPIDPMVQNGSPV